MPNHAGLWLRASALTLCLLLVPAARAPAQGDLPEFMPFRWIDGEGSITVAGGDVYLRAFDAEFRLAPGSDGIHLGDDIHVVTSVAYPVPAPPASPLELVVNRLVVRMSVDGQCFNPRGRALLFRATDGGAIASCVSTGAQIFDGDGAEVWDGDFDRGDIQAVTVELVPLGRRGRWKLRSIAAFAGPGFPFPVAGWHDQDPPDLVEAGVTLIVGDDGLFSPFRAVGFRTLAP